MNKPLAHTPQRPLSALYAEHYWGHGHGVMEKTTVFIGGTDFAACCAKVSPHTPLTVAELGFGTGLNLALALQTFATHAPANTHLQFCSYEAHPLMVAELAAIHAALPPDLAALLAPVRRAWPSLTAGWHHLSLNPHATLHLWVGEAAQGLPSQPFNAHIWWLDGFSPARNPAMWALPLLQHVAAKSHAGARLATYSAARVVRENLTQAGFTVQKVAGVPPKRHRLIGFLRG